MKRAERCQRLRDDECKQCIAAKNKCSRCPFVRQVTTTRAARRERRETGKKTQEGSRFRATLPPPSDGAEPQRPAPLFHPPSGRCFTPLPTDCPYRHRAPLPPPEGLYRKEFESPSRHRLYLLARSYLRTIDAAENKSC